ncbi:hypothetical protein L596_008045 [Steinernema carpocapsae]|uniref:Uncharacterized protein n=1 Tax=Steinernema carpocapsae TaxID=34508 RepID=A0A4U5PB92_STECR|nr:hypothetical protein L596_008045 [Steinernema carpocapsae]
MPVDFFGAGSVERSNGLVDGSRGLVLNVQAVHVLRYLLGFFHNLLSLQFALLLFQLSLNFLKALLRVDLRLGHLR